MKIENIYIGQPVYALDRTTTEFKIFEYKIIGIKSTPNFSLFEIHIESRYPYNATSLHFENGKFVSDHFSFYESEMKERYKSKIVKQLNDLENQIKNIRLKNWELLCK